MRQDSDTEAAGSPTISTHSITNDEHQANTIFDEAVQPDIEGEPNESSNFANRSSLVLETILDQAASAKRETACADSFDESGIQEGSLIAQLRDIKLSQQSRKIAPDEYLRTQGHLPVAARKGLLQLDHERREADMHSLRSRYSNSHQSTSSSGHNPTANIDDDDLPIAFRYSQAFSQRGSTSAPCGQYCSDENGQLVDELALYRERTQSLAVMDEEAMANMTLRERALYLRQCGPDRKSLYSNDSQNPISTTWDEGADETLARRAKQLRRRSGVSS